MAQTEVENNLIKSLDINDLKNDPNNLSLEAVTSLVLLEALETLKIKTESEFKELKDRQDLVASLHKTLKTINRYTNEKGELDISKNEELKKLLDEASKLGVEIDVNKQKYNAHEREMLVENFRITIEGLNTKNDMQLQVINQLTNKRYECFQMAKSIVKPLDEDKKNKARSIAR
ncbi:hypothetical protein BN1013_01019 [Candidatus Rubidus massiliensis]|nr:hypothetical protein BN1013_01019 [Candidatus Rubidus massiliensis]